MPLNQQEYELMGKALQVASALFSGIIAYMMARLNANTKIAITNSEEAARRVETVKATLENTTDETTAKLDSLKIIAKSTHKLVNNNMRVALERYFLACQRIAGLTGEAQDLSNAQNAKKNLEDHEIKDQE